MRRGRYVLQGDIFGDAVLLCREHGYLQVPHEPDNPDLVEFLQVADEHDKEMHSER